MAHCPLHGNSGKTLFFRKYVYTNAGNGDIAPALDKQEDVYKAMLKLALSFDAESVGKNRF